MNLKTLLPLALICSVFPQLTNGQSNGTWVIETLRSGILGAWSRSADFDNDGDPDILLQSGDTIYWYENLRPGWTPHIVDGTFTNSTYGYVDVLDIDGDGDMDILKAPATGDGTDELTWNENQSNGSVWVKHTILTLASSIGWLQNSYGDLDGDGDLDMAISEVDFVNVPPLGSLYWLENMGDGDIWTKHPLKSGNHNYSSIADMDGDGDLDIAASWAGIFWLENQLPATDWTLHQVVSSGINSHYVGVCEDLDGDGDADIASAPSATNGGLVYYTNPGWQEVNIHPTGKNLYIGSTGDIDGDGDTDITYAGAGYLPQGLGWAENQNNGATWVIHDITPHDLIQRIPTGLEDIDGDGDIDIVSLTFNVNTSIGSVFWASNPMISTGTSLVDKSPLSLSISPNPVGDFLQVLIEGERQGTFQVQIFDLAGRPVYTTEIREHSPMTLPLKDMPGGTYLLKVFDEKRISIQRIVKQ